VVPDPHEAGIASPGAPPPAFANPAEYRLAREALDAAGFDEKRVAAALGEQLFPSLRVEYRPWLLRVTREPTPLNTVIRIFLAGVPVDVDRARAALAPLPLDAWARAGMLTVGSEGVRRAVRLQPIERLLLAFDSWESGPGGMPRPDHVMGVAGSSLNLLKVTVRDRVASTLDLGTGSGVQALFAARHSDRVVATDPNPRALAFARFNAALNGFANIEVREGSLFEPAKGERFDLVVSNPPFVITPDRRLAFRDGGLQADDFSRRVVAEVPAYLTEGGWFQGLVNWLHVKGEDPVARLAGWVEGSGCDTWVLRGETTGCAEYVTTWIGQGEKPVAHEHVARFESWLDYLEGLGAEAVSAGLFTMRRRPGTDHWFRYENRPRTKGEIGATIVRGFALRDYLATIMDDAPLLAACLVVAPDARLEQVCVPDQPRWDVRECHLELSGGLGFRGRIEPSTALALARCDGARSLAEVVAELSEAVNVPEAELVPPLLDLVRGLVLRGFLLPPHLAGIGAE